ncbi:MAG: TetR/AcrR family transcriptional regulator [Myxococcota bacterium]
MPRAFTEPEQLAIRSRLLQAGREALPRTGFRRTAIEDLTRAVGISKGAFYRFFETKEALWTALLAEGEAVARGGIRDALADPAPGRLRRVLRAMFRTVWDDPVLLALADPEDAAWLLRSVPADALAVARRDDDRFFGEVASALIATGDLRPEVAPDLFAGLPGAALALAQHPDLLGRGRADAVVELIVDGLVARMSP